MKSVPAELLDFIRTGKKFIVTGHKEEDGDCVGSQLALCSVLRRLGKEAIPCSTGPFRRTEIKIYEKYFCKTIDEKTRESARVIITDCSSLDRTGDLAPFLRGLPAAFIDHHEYNPAEPEQGNCIFYVCEDAPSVTHLILLLTDALGLELTAEEAEYLLFGLCTDTGFFRHGDSGSAATFEAAARLVRAGASPKKAYLAMYGGKSLDSRYLLGHILSRAESHFEGRLLVSSETCDEYKQYGAEGRDSDALYQLLQTIAGVEAVVIIKQEKPDNCSIGLRSIDQVDVAEMARLMGGGGHKNAAGASAAGTIPEVKEKILDLFKKVWK